MRVGAEQQLAGPCQPALGDDLMRDAMPADVDDLDAEALAESSCPGHRTGLRGRRRRHRMVEHDERPLRRRHDERVAPVERVRHEQRLEQDRPVCTAHDDVAGPHFGRPAGAGQDPLDGGQGAHGGHRRSIGRARSHTATAEAAGLEAIAVGDTNVETLTVAAAVVVFSVMPSDAIVLPLSPGHNRDGPDG